MMPYSDDYPRGSREHLRWYVPPLTGRWFAVLALALAMVAWFFLSVPPSEDPAQHLSQAALALVFGLLISPIFAVLSAFVHPARQFRIGVWTLLAVALEAWLVFLLYCASFGLLSA